MKSTNKRREFEEDINIILRCKPSQNTSQGSHDRWSCLDIIPDSETIRLVSPSYRQDIKDYSFDRVFNSYCYQEEVYEPIKNIISDAILGYNATIIATGKTYTLLGTPAQEGIIPRVLRDIFNQLNLLYNNNLDNNYQIEMSCVELYNNYFYNLLTSQENENNTEGLVPHNLHEDKIDLHDSPATGVFFVSPRPLRKCIKSAEDGYRLLQTSSECLNSRHPHIKHSKDLSRGHVIYTLYIETEVNIVTETTSSRKFRFCKIQFVDLAGSERQNYVTNNIGKNIHVNESLMATENHHINLSLLALGEVIHNLSTNCSLAAQYQNKLENYKNNKERMPTIAIPRAPKYMRIPYLDNKLTHLLSDSIGGNSKTMFLATISTDSVDYKQTLHTLNYLESIKKIKNRVRLNQIDLFHNNREIIQILSESQLVQKLKYEYLDNTINTKDNNDDDIMNTSTSLEKDISFDSILSDNNENNISNRSKNNSDYTLEEEALSLQQLRKQTLKQLNKSNNEKTKKKKWKYFHYLIIIIIIIIFGLFLFYQINNNEITTDQNRKNIQSSKEVTARLVKSDNIKFEKNKKISLFYEAKKLPSRYNDKSNKLLIAEGNNVEKIEILNTISNKWKLFQLRLSRILLNIKLFFRKLVNSKE